MIYRVLFLAVLLSAGGCDRSERAAEPPTVATPGDAAQPPAADPGPAPEIADDGSAPQAQPPAVRAPAPLRVAISEDGIDAALAAADLALAEGRLAFREGNALGLYLAVLDIDPANARAIAGKASSLAALLERARGQIAEGRLDEAASTCDVLSRHASGSPEVERLLAEFARAVDIRDTLSLADAAAASGRSVGDEEGTAQALLQGLLERYPGSPEALVALDSLLARLVAAAVASAEQGEFVEADRLLGDAGRAWPGSPALQDAGARVQELRHLRATRLFEEAAVALAARDPDAAERILRQVERLSVQQEEVDDLRLRIDSVRFYDGHSPGQVVRDPLASGGDGPEMVVLPLGSFLMGAGEGDPGRRSSEGPAREVRFPRGFLLARTEVTVGQFRRFVVASGYRPTSSERRRSTIYDEKSGGMVERRGVGWEHDFAGQRADDSLPVLHVSWHDARAYAEWLARETGRSYRLPSEAEFEYALRAGSATPYPWGNGSPPRLLGNVTGKGDRSALRREWSNAFAGYSDGFWGPAPAGSFEANAFGLHDLVGNVSEWVEDCWHDSFSRAPRDGKAWVNPGCARRVYRGSSWASAPEHSRSAFRSEAAPETTHGRLGFRVAR